MNIETRQIYVPGRPWKRPIIIWALDNEWQNVGYRWSWRKLLWVLEFHRYVWPRR